MNSKQLHITNPFFLLSQEVTKIDLLLLKKKTKQHRVVMLFSLSKHAHLSSPDGGSDINEQPPMHPPPSVLLGPAATSAAAATMAVEEEQYWW